ncbi:outer membrane autotransporter [Burkholderia lata]|uniref:Outer membrane autotransporter n=2 Tax=Burkholderia lata (strain ATCC 17760 / DSM 23089 / LMG 22485 / NCIMB 9086 / R18194 / 383) TaxID=482957 RepID=A0A6P2GQU1_BURL3|nr:outer membrane autotransporter [Burkholderia lata]
MLTGPLTVPNMTVTGTTTLSSISTSNATITGGTISGSSIDFGTQINSNGGNGLRVSPSGIYNPSTFVGPNSGAAYPAANPWAVGVGAYSLYSLNQSQAEVTGIGTLSCARLTTGNYNVCLGLHSLGNDPTTNTSVAVGNDSVRNEIGGNNITAVGGNSMRNGSGDQTTAIGSGAMRGNASSIIFGGTVTSGDQVSVTVTCNQAGACSNSPKTYSYTLTGSDTIATLVTNLANLMNAAPVNETPVNGNVLVGMQARGAQLGPTNVLALDFPGSSSNGWKVSVGVSVSGAATETYTIGTGVNSQSNVIIGSFAVDGSSVQNLSNSVFIGQGIAPSLTNVVEAACIGVQSCFKLQNGNGNTSLGAWTLQQNVSGNFNVAVGDFSGQNVTGGSNVLSGANSGQNMTTGSYNTIAGDYTGDSTSKGCITTGSANTQIGRLACVQSPTSNGQLSIQNAIYGSSNNGSYLTPSTGYIGIYQPSPLAMLDVKGVDTSSSTNAFRINDSTNTTLFTVNDQGFVNINTTATSGDSLDLSQTANSCCGVNIKMTGDGATTPAKWLRVHAGAMNIMSNSYSPIVTVTDGGNISAIGTGTMPVYGITGAATNAPHKVIGNVTLSSGSATVTLSGSAVFTSSSSYVCTANDTTAAAAVKVGQTSGTSITFTGTGTDTVQFSCTGN